MFTFYYEAKKVSHSYIRNHYELHSQRYFFYFVKSTMVDGGLRNGGKQTVVNIRLDNDEVYPYFYYPTAPQTSIKNLQSLGSNYKRFT